MVINYKRKVEEEMARQKITLRNLAEAMAELLDEDITIQRMSGMINSENPQMRTVGRVADALRVDVKYFFEEGK